MNVVETMTLGKRYGRTWALRDCGLAVPAGGVTALVGPNGAGKSTLLYLTVGLVAPTTGGVLVLGSEPAGSSKALARVAFVAQDTPLYSNISVADTLHLVRNLNRRWDQRYAEVRMAELGIPLSSKVGKLSGGQQAQLALTVALARHPELLVLDEPLARLDPLARHDFMASVMEAVAAEGLSVVFSSHVVAELERVADYLVVLASGRVQLAGKIDDLLAAHQLLTGPTAAIDGLTERQAIVDIRRTGAQSCLLMRTGKPDEQPSPGWARHPVSLEQLVLAYLRESAACALPGRDSPRGVNRTAIKT